MKKTNLPKPTDSELSILRVLWRNGPSTVRQVVDEINQSQETGYTTVLKLMQIMLEKGLLRRDDTERSHVFEATLAEEETQRQLVGHLLERAFAGSAHQLVLRALSARKATREELAEIRKLLDEMEKGIQMKALLDMLSQPFANRLGWALLHSLWQGAMVAMLYGLLRFGLRRASANARYLAGCFSLLLLLAAPVVTLMLSGNTAEIAAGRGAGLNISGAGLPIAASGSDHAFPAGSSTLPFTLQMAEFLERALPWLVAAWFAGVGLFSFRLLNGFWRIQSLKSDGTEWLDSAWLERLNELKRRFNVSRPVRLLKSAFVEVPTVIGWLRPVILLPASCLTGLTPAQLEAILAHELAHICRRDYIVNVFQNLVETLMFYHPAVWWISRCIREEREHCCDDLVVEVCGNRMAYARALAAMEGLRGLAPQLAFAASGGSLLNRIRRLLGLPAETGTSSWRQACGLALLAMGFVLVALGVYLMLIPASYQAVARIKVERDTPHEIEASQGKLKFNYDVNAFQTELAMILSPLVLKQVVEDLQLSELWGKRYDAGGKFLRQEALQLLMQRTSVQQFRDTSLVDIRACSEDPAEAALIANAIAAAYKRHRMQMALDLMTSGITALEQRWNEHSNRVYLAQLEVDRKRTELRISDPSPQDTTPTPMITAEVLREYQRTLTIYGTSLAYKQAQLDNLKKLDRAKLRNSIQTALEQPDAQLATLFTELDLAEQRLQSLAVGFSAQHDVYQNAKKNIEDLNLKIDRKLDGILAGLENRFEQTRASITTINQSFEAAKSNDLAMAEMSRPYYVSKQQLAELLQFKQTLGMKIAAAKTELILPRNSMVEIVDHAAQNFGPVSPNRVRATALMLSGLLLGILGLVTLKGGRGRALSPLPA